MNSKQSLTKLMDGEIRNAESNLARLKTDLARLKAARALFNGATPIKQPIKSRRLRPSADAVRDKLVTPGGRLTGYADRIRKQLAAGPKPTKEIVDALFVKGLGMSRKAFASRMVVALSSMAARGDIKGRPIKGTKRYNWSLK